MVFLASAREANAITFSRSNKAWRGENHQNLLFLPVVFLLLLLASCTPRPDTTILYPHPQTDAQTNTVTVYVATTREPAENPLDGFTREREDELSYAAFVISIPPNHVSGEIEWPYSVKVRPDEQFTVVSHKILSKSAFDAQVASAARQQYGGKVSLFVHGFNVSFQEGLFRMAQLSYDANVPGVPVFFSWPSQARLFDYATDKESATFSRDGLTSVLEQLTAQSGIRSVMVFAHSMGGWLTMEALRQVSLKGEKKVLRKLNVILAAPDIDEDVFNTQVDAIGPLNPPLLVMVSTDDRALQASKFIQGNRQRTGQLDITDPEVIEQAQRMNVTLLDISAIKTNDALNHSRYAAFAAIYPELDADLELGSGVRQAGARALEAVGDAIAAPFSISANAIARQ